jgi:hypothetical protein
MRLDKGSECEPDLRIILGGFRVGAVGSQLQSGLCNLKIKKFWTSKMLFWSASRNIMFKKHNFAIISIVNSN